MIAEQLVDDVPFREVPVVPDADLLADGDLISISLSTRTDYATHSLHRFPAKFVPQIPAWAIRQYSSRGGLVLDPFMGSGTSMVEALIAGRVGVGYDIDPLARLISRAKSTPIPAARVMALREAIDAGAFRAPRLAPPPMDGVVRFDHWFSRDAWAKLQWILDRITRLDMANDERQLLLAVFSSTIRLASNADDQSQKTYVSGTRRKTPPDALQTFDRQLMRAGRSMADLESLFAPHGTLPVDVPDDGDALKMAQAPASVDLIVTSPPYLDSVDYPYNFMLEYFWLGPTLGVQSRRDFNAMRRGPVGAKRPGIDDPTFPPEVEGIFDPSNVAEDRLSAIAAYLRSMRQHLRAAAEALRPGGRYVLVVGNSNTNGQAVPIHNCLASMAAAAGLRTELAFAYRVRRHYMKFPRSSRGGIMLLDWVLVLQKQGGPIPPPKPLPMHQLVLSPSAVAF